MKIIYSNRNRSIDAGLCTLIMHPRPWNQNKALDLRSRALFWFQGLGCIIRVYRPASPDLFLNSRMNVLFGDNCPFYCKLKYFMYFHLQEDEPKGLHFYAWIFGSGMLALGTLTILSSVMVFCYCSEKLKKRREEARRRGNDKQCEYERVDSVSSIVSHSGFYEDYTDGPVDSVTIIWYSSQIHCGHHINHHISDLLFMHLYHWYSSII